jgi:hypothetical protein
LTPFLYVQEEFDNVKRALTESLRYDYGPGQTVDYYDECQYRLAGIEQELVRLNEGVGTPTSAIVAQLWDLANRLTLIERSHLGEFSWPFAEAIRRIATTLLSEEEGLRGRVEPIIHMIAEGTSYQILSENIPSLNKRRSLFTVAFPRQLKNHVLMHALFGHELGHATFYSTRIPGANSPPGAQPPSKSIITILRSAGPLQDCANVMAWMRSDESPPTVRNRAMRGSASITESNLGHWHVELVCDLFGLVIFGPAFVAAHRTYLEPSCKSKFDVEVEKMSHPAYALRRALLRQALRILGYSKPIIPVEKKALFDAEVRFLSYIGDDEGEFGRWAEVFSDDQVERALSVIQTHFQLTGTSAARQPDPETLICLVDRIARHLPPIREEISDDGVPKSFEVRIEEQLYAGWTYWLGRDALSEGAPLTFFELNQLCDLAILQQKAIEIIAERDNL